MAQPVADDFGGRAGGQREGRCGMPEVVERILGEPLPLTRRSKRSASWSGWTGDPSSLVNTRPAPSSALRARGGRRGRGRGGPQLFGRPGLQLDPLTGGRLARVGGVGHIADHQAVAQCVAERLADQALAERELARPDEGTVPGDPSYGLTLRPDPF